MAVLDDTRVNNKTYRFKFCDSVVNSINTFAKLHQYDDKNTYKEAWAEWIDDNEDEIRRESERLISSGYNGNILTKMYKSGRYYFRNKPAIPSDPKNRREYISISHSMLDDMDEHIKMHYISPEYTPAIGFDDFCNSYKHNIVIEIKLFASMGFTDPKEITAKFKKTYKNRYFQLTRSK